MPKRRKVKLDPKRTYDVIEECIDAGARYGIYRNWKYSSEPMPFDEEVLDRLVQQIKDAVMLELCEHITWDEDDDD